MNGVITRLILKDEYSRYTLDEPRLAYPTRFPIKDPRSMDDTDAFIAANRAKYLRRGRDGSPVRQANNSQQSNFAGSLQNNSFKDLIRDTSKERRARRDRIQFENHERYHRQLLRLNNKWQPDNKDSIERSAFSGQIRPEPKKQPTQPDIMIRQGRTLQRTDKNPQSLGEPRSSQTTDGKLDFEEHHHIRNKLGHSMSNALEDTSAIEVGENKESISEAVSKAANFSESENSSQGHLLATPQATVLGFAQIEQLRACECAKMTLPKTLEELEWKRIRSSFATVALVLHCAVRWRRMTSRHGTIVERHIKGGQDLSQPPRTSDKAKLQKKAQKTNL